MAELKNRVEAILFTTGRFISVEDIAKMCEIGSLGVVLEALNLLKEDYEKRGSALCMLNENGLWKLAIKKEFLHLTEKLLTDSELDRPTQQTLAVVAYKNPAMQSEIIKIRGNGAYDHIKALKELGFVTSEKSGRTRILKLTNKFFDYFDVVEDQLKSKLDKASAAGDENKLEKQNEN